MQIILQSLIGLIIVAGLAGLFGQGWISTVKQAFPSAPLTVDYERLLRANAPTEMTIIVSHPLASDMLQIGLGSALLDHVSVGSTQPRATSIDATPHGVNYTFQLGPERQGKVLFKLSPRIAGPLEAVLSTHGEHLKLPLFIYP